MPDSFEIIEEARQLRDTFEISWQLPWYAGPKDPLWNHRLVKIMLNLPESTFDVVMTELLDDESFALRGLSLHLVNARVRTDFLPTIRQRLLNDESMAVRALAAAAVGSFGLGEENLDALLAINPKEHAEVKKAAISVFRLKRVHAAVPILAGFIGQDNEDDGVLIAAASALGDIGGAEAEIALMQLLKNDAIDDEPRKSACAALAKIATKTGIETLYAAATDARPWVRAASLRALGPLEKEKAEEALLSGCSTEQPWMVRTHAVEALSNLPSDRARPHLSRFISDSETPVRSEACAALGRLADEKAMPLLRRALDDAELLVRIQAVYAVTAITGQDFGLKDEMNKDQLDPKNIQRIVTRAKISLDRG